MATEMATKTRCGKRCQAGSLLAVLSLAEGSEGARRVLVCHPVGTDGYQFTLRRGGMDLSTRHAAFLRAGFR